MSTKRLLGITIFGVLFMLAVVGAMLLSSFINREGEAIALPEASASREAPGEIEPDALDRVEATTETIQDIVSTLSRPEVYSRDIVIQSFWEGGHAIYNISVSVRHGMTSLRVRAPIGEEKRIIVTPDTLYIWYDGDRTPFAGSPGSSGDLRRTSDEWQMLATYEDILNLDKSEIIDAGYIELVGEDFIYAAHLSPLFGYTMRYYVSLEHGLVVRAEEFDESGKLVYRMTAGECMVGEADKAEFILPDGTDLGA